MAVADGCTSKVVSETGERVTLSEDTIKLIDVLPGSSIVVLTSGRSHFDCVTVADRCVESVTGTGGLPALDAAESTVLMVAERLANYFAELARRHPVVDDGLESGIELVVAGFSPGAAEPEVFVFTVPQTGDEMRHSTAFQAGGIVAIPRFGEATESALALFSASGDDFLASLNDDPSLPLIGSSYGYKLRCSSASQVDRQLRDRIIQLAASDSELLTSEGVGGDWRFAIVTPEGLEQRIETIGPYRNEIATG